MFKLLVDFNEVREGRVGGLQKYADAPRPLAPGDRVLVHDGGEEEAWAVVGDVQDDRVYLTVDWSTFGPAGQFQHHYEPTGAWWSVVVGAVTIMQDGQARLLEVVRQSADGQAAEVIRDDEGDSAAAPAVLP